MASRLDELENLRIDADRIINVMQACNEERGIMHWPHNPEERFLQMTDVKEMHFPDMIMEFRRKNREMQASYEKYEGDRKKLQRLSLKVAGLTVKQQCMACLNEINEVSQLENQRLSF